jgi:hypothetical protein
LFGGSRQRGTRGGSAFFGEKSLQSHLLGLDLCAAHRIRGPALGHLGKIGLIVFNVLRGRDNSTERQWSPRRPRGRSRHHPGRNRRGNPQGIGHGVGWMNAKLIMPPKVLAVRTRARIGTSPDWRGWVTRSPGPYPNYDRLLARRMSPASPVRPRGPRGQRRVGEGIGIATALTPGPERSPTSDRSQGLSSRLKFRPQVSPP